MSFAQSVNLTENTQSGFLAKNRPGITRKKGDPKIYHHQAIIEFLKDLWVVTNLACAERLKAAIPLWLPYYQLHNKNVLKEKEEKLLLEISPSSIKRLLGKLKSKYKKFGLSTTKPGSLIKKQVPIKLNQWDESKTGFIEADTVAHCGSSASGTFVYTVNTVDIATGWTEPRAIWGKGKKSSFEAIESIEKAIPFKILGFDSDNGSEFINLYLYKYFTQIRLPVEYTRSRSYQKNDNAHIEGKNWTHIRQYLVYQRFDNPKIVDMLNDIYKNDWSLFFNFFIPSSKIISKNRIGSKIIKRHDNPKTPLDRLIESYAISETKKKRLITLRKTLNPFQFQSVIRLKIKELLNLLD